MATDRPQRSYTPRELAPVLRVSPDRIRAMIARGELGALDMGERGRHRYVILPAHLEAWMAGRQASPPPPPKAAGRRKRSGYIDYYPD